MWETGASSSIVSFAPATEVAAPAAGQAHNPRRPIPRRPEVPLHVRIERKQLALAVERDLIRECKQQPDERALVPGVGLDGRQDPLGSQPASDPRPE